jgi:hypothetical protein
MVVAIDLNDVIRAYTRNFAKIYQKEYNRSFDKDSIVIDTNDLSKVFPFDSEAEYKRFVYQDYPYELFGKCDTVESLTSSALINWCEGLKNHDIEENIDVMIVSPMEYGLTIQSTYFFLSKIGCRVREVYFPTDSLTIWDKCDVLITANPKLLNNKPDGKFAVKIKADYNKECPADDVYTSACEFFNDTNNTVKYID